MTINEAERLAALRSYRVLDTPPEEDFDRLTALACDLFGTPIAAVSLIDADRQWFKSAQGLDVRQTPRRDAFCDHAIRSPDAVMVVEDAARDLRFIDNPLVAGPPHIRFYAAAVLTDPEGHRLGSLCVIDREPRRRPDRTALARLKMLAEIAVDKLVLARTEREDKEKTRILDLAASMAGIGYWRTELSGDRISWSSEIYRIFGVEKGPFTPSRQSLLPFHVDNDIEKVRELMAQAAASKTGFADQFRIRRPDGQVRIVEFKGACELDGAGEVAAFFGVMQDVTDRDAALRRVSRSEARFRLLADNMGDVISRIRADGSSDYISPGIEQLIGFTPQEMIGQPAQAFVLKQDRPIVMRALADIAAGAERRSVQIRAVHKSGAHVWVETNFRRISGLNVDLVETVAVIRDITERKALEEQLLEARDKAEEAARVKAEFLANMSHELRTPLTSILGFSKLLQADPSLDREAARNVDRVAAAGRALLATINDVLDFSKLEAGLVALDPQPVSPDELLRDALELFEPQAEAKGVTLRLDAADLPSCVKADDDRLRQILLNLIGNAVKFTSQGSVTLKARYGDGRLRCEVIDTGAGIPEDLLGRLFQRFSQVDASTTRTHGGTGLGLAICKGLAEAMGGSIGVSSEEGRGSVFWFEVPAAAARRTREETDEGGADGALFRRGARVLVVDDNFANRELVRAVLEPQGLAVSEAVNGQEAVELATVEAFDLILMDVRMPVMDGPSACRRIRATPGPNQGAPILAFTADADDPRGLLVGAGFNDKVVKPLTPLELLKSMLSWLSVAALPAVEERAAG